jgi:hypothetical protein
MVVWLEASSLYASCKMLWVSVAVFPTLKQNLRQILCSFTDSMLNTKGASTHLITEPVIETKWNLQSTWNRMACITNGQITRSLKQPLTWPMHCCFSTSLQELSEHTWYVPYYMEYKIHSNLRCIEFLSVGFREKNLERCTFLKFKMLLNF